MNEKKPCGGCESFALTGSSSGVCGAIAPKWAEEHRSVVDAYDASDCATYKAKPKPGLGWCTEHGPIAAKDDGGCPYCVRLVTGPGADQAVAALRMVFELFHEHLGADHKAAALDEDKGLRDLLRLAEEVK